jgi:hypothetical protein
MRATLVRRLGIYLSWLIWGVAFWLAVSTHIPQIYLVLLFFGGFIPYLVSIHVIEPWLDKRHND